MRGGMDASQYKDYVLTLLFMKYVSDKYAGQPSALDRNCPLFWFVYYRCTHPALLNQKDHLLQITTKKYVLITKQH